MVFAFPHRAAARLYPVFATLTLTAAAFLLPATADTRQVLAAVDEIRVSATHVPHDAGAVRPSTQE